MRLREAEGVAELKETKQRAMELETQVGVLGGDGSETERGGGSG